MPPKRESLPRAAKNSTDVGDDAGKSTTEPVHLGEAGTNVATTRGKKTRGRPRGSKTRGNQIRGNQTRGNQTRGNKRSRHGSKTPLDEIHVSSGGSLGASNKKQAVNSPPQIATPPRSSEPPSVPLELEFLVRGDHDKRISSDERARRRQIQEDIDWLGKWLLEYAYHQIKKEQGLYPEGPVEVADDLVASSFWWREAIGTISKEDVMEQFRVLERQLHEAPDKVFVQAMFGWTSYQMWKDGRNIQVIKGHAVVWSHVQGVDIEDEYWQMLRQGFRE
ncbi:hypothetical protein CGCA056_v000965 [Colletotrichum aenigma]|uniref:uncharacterized protein n=1 Tax=Colletotrichum aenigma TaxID=1215731 RepID=UPI001872F7C2|nr:uncharacterized protein CGCA056_v000965 [Colletotrichum aenigma]KAF5527026.1 hypothetical protein CGCA056_v000965 [Colletotrichum aenigma]